MSENKKKKIVIVGAGIVGVCTAYYLSRHPEYSEATHHITIIEAVKPAAGASGKAGGLLALWAFPEQIVPLSFRLHQELADEFDGANNWGYRRVSTLSVSGGGSKKLNGGLPSDLDWIRQDLVNDIDPLGGADVTGQVHPNLFTNFILDRAKEKGVELHIGKVARILQENGKIQGVDVSNGEKIRTMQADQVIVTAGPWTSRLLDCPISGLIAHSVTIDPGKEVSPYALFTDYLIKTDHGRKRVSPEIYARKDEVYICGEGDPKIELPDTAADVVVNQGKCEDLFSYAGAISEELKNGKRLVSQACFLPVVDQPGHSSPLIGETDVKGLYVAAGHSCWGINNGPATGKLMSEIVLDGSPKSATLGRSFDPKYLVKFK